MNLYDITKGVRSLLARRWRGTDPKVLAARLQKTTAPKHVAIIMDGNGRWAQRRGLPRIAGHRAGVETLKEVIRASREVGVHYLTVYAFSTENWSRPSDEVQFLMRLLVEVMERELEELHEAGVRLRVIGRRDNLEGPLRERIAWAEERTRANSAGQLLVAFAYGGRAEIVDVARRIADAVESGALSPDSIDEETIRAFSYAPDVPDPDLLIRTGGEFRLSNFLLWQTAYTELYVTGTFWPDFGRSEYYSALLGFSRRERRFGGLGSGS